MTWGLLSLRTVDIYLFPVISECRLKGVWLGRRDHDTEQTQARDFWLRGYKKNHVVQVPCKQRENLFFDKITAFSNLEIFGIIIRTLSQ